MTTEQLYQKCIDLDPHFAAAYRTRHVCKKILKVLVNGVPMKAQALFLKSIELYPTVAITYYHLQRLLRLIKPSW